VSCFSVSLLAEDEGESPIPIVPLASGALEESNILFNVTYSIEFQTCNLGVSYNFFAIPDG